MKLAALSVFDFVSIRERRKALFGGLESGSTWHDYERQGTTKQHCGICPRADGESCGLSCENERKAIDDGVVVS